LRTQLAVSALNTTATSDECLAEIPGVTLRWTVYDVGDAANQLAATELPDVDEMPRESLTDPADPDEVAAFFESLATTS
jgi:hypothetical protein